MAELSKIVCLEQDCRHGTEQTSGSGSGNDTYTKAEIDSKDSAVKAVADKAQSTAASAATAASNAQSTADSAKSTASSAAAAAADAQNVNKTQDGQITELQKAAHTHNNKDILDKIEQPFTTADQTKLNSLENYKHPSYLAKAMGFYKFATDTLGHFLKSENVTKKDIVGLGIPESNTTYTLKRSGNTSVLEGSDGSKSVAITSDCVTHGYETSSDVEPYRCYLIFYHRKPDDDNTMIPYLASSEEIWVNEDHSGIGVKGTITAGNFSGANATTKEQGLMSPEDKAKLDGIDPDLYLPKAGGVMTGDIDLASNGVDLLVGSQRATQQTYASAVAGATISTKQTFSSGLPERKSLVGSFLDQNSVWHSIISVRHRNGYNDGVNYGMYLRSLLTSDGSLIWNKQTGAGKWQGERVLLDSTNYSSYAAKSDHTHAMITNSALWVSGADNTAKWARLGTLVSSGNFSNAVIRVWSGDGANGRANQNSSFEIQIKDGWQSTLSANKACGVTVYRISCSNVKVKVIPTAHDTYTVWAYLPWGYWNGNYAVYGKYKSWTSQHLIQSEEPEGTGADTAYYDQAFLTSTVAKATEATALAETAWTDVPETNISPRYGKNIKYLKSGNTVYVRGSISFSASLNNPCCGTMPSELLPDDYQDHVFTAWNLKGGVPTAYPVVLGTDGKIILMNPTSTANWFVAGRAYNFNFNYHIG